MNAIVTIEPSPYKGQPAISYMTCPCGRRLGAHLGHVQCPDCGQKYAPDGTVVSDAAWEAVVGCPCCLSRSLGLTTRKEIA